MNGIKGILFDFGGTLDTNGTHWGIMLQEAYREAGFSLEDKIFREIYVQGERQLAAQPVIATNDTFKEVLQKKLAIELDYGVTHGFLSDNTDTRNRMALIAEKCYATARDHIDGIRPLLKKLHNDYRLALVSNFYGNLSAVFGRLRPKKLFRYRYRIGMRRDSANPARQFSVSPSIHCSFLRPKPSSWETVTKTTSLPPFRWVSHRYGSKAGAGTTRTTSIPHRTSSPTFTT